MTPVMQRTLSQARRRWLMQRWLAVGGWTLAAAGAVMALVVVALRLWGTPWQGWVYALPWAAAVVTAGVLAWRRRPDDKALAALLDDKAKLQDRLGTALYVEARASDPFAQQVVREAGEAAGRIRVAELLPWRWTRSLGWAAAGAVLAWGLFLFLPGDLLGLGEKRKEAQTQQEQARQQAQAAQEELVKTLEAVKKLDDPREHQGDAAREDWRNSLKGLAELSQKELTSPQTQEQAQTQLAQLQEKLAQAADKKEQELQTVANALSQLDAGQPGPADRFTEALRRGDFATAAKELEALAQEAQKLPEQERQVLQQQLQNLAQQLAQMAQEQKEQQAREQAQMQQALQNAGLSPQQAQQMAQQAQNGASAQQMQQQLQQQGVSQSQAQQLAQQMAQAQQQNQGSNQAQQTSQNMSQAMGQMSQSMSSPANSFSSTQPNNNSGAQQSAASASQPAGSSASQSMANRSNSRQNQQGRQSQQNQPGASPGQSLANGSNSQQGQQGPSGSPQQGQGNWQQGQSQMNQQLQQLAQMQQQLQQMRQGQSQAQQAMQSMCRGGAQGGSPGMGSSGGGGRKPQPNLPSMGLKPNKPGGNGRGGGIGDEPGGDPIGPEHGYGGYQTDVQSQNLAGQGKIIASWMTDGPNTAGPAQTGFDTAVKEARSDAEKAVTEDRVPRRYHEAIKEYFNQLPQSPDEVRQAAPAAPK